MAGNDMPRKSVIAQVARKHRVSKVEAEKIVRTVLESVATELAERGRFHVAEVGSVTVAERPPRRYFNPRTGEESISGGGKALKINISKQMKVRLD